MAGALGCMRIHGREVLEAALDAGLDSLDTADVYGEAPGDSERLVGAVLRDADVPVRLVTKGGLVRAGRSWRQDGRASHLKAACLASAERLGVPIDLYLLHAPDPRVSLATSMRALARLQRDGVVRRVGVCNVSVRQLEEARDVADIAAVQVELSPFAPTAVWSGVVDRCLELGIEVQAHSPLGGHRKRRAARHPALRAVARRLGSTPEEVALAWLGGLGVVCIPGASRIETVASIARAGALSLEVDAISELDAAFPDVAALRVPRLERPPAPNAEGEVVLVAGIPGAGKSTLGAEWEARGYLRLNRDRIGGTLAGVAKRLDAALGEGTRRVVLDNTYTTRAQRGRVVSIAHRHGVPIRCVWRDTSLHEAQRNAVERILRRFGRLLEPEELDGKLGAEALPPRAQHRHMQVLEVPAVDEGLASVERVPFSREAVGGGGSAVVLCTLEGVLEPERVAKLQGKLVVAALWAPEVAAGERTRSEAVEVAEAHAREAGLELRVAVCPHGPGPPKCWCRKPLPGLGVWWTRELGLDPERCVALGSGAADRGFAERCGFGFAEVEAYFQR